QWLAERAAELLPVPYFHVVFTLPAPIADIAYQNKAVIYDLLFKVSAETMLTIPADPIGAVAGALLPRGVHAAGSHRRYRLPEQGGDLRSPVQGLGRDHADNRSRSDRSCCRCPTSTWCSRCRLPSPISPTRTRR